jgi:hypothetical protein
MGGKGNWDKIVEVYIIEESIDAFATGITVVMK